MLEGKKLCNVNYWLNSLEMLMKYFAQVGMTACKIQRNFIYGAFIIFMPGCLNHCASIAVISPKAGAVSVKKRFM
jgi:hypothetical protein